MVQLTTSQLVKVNIVNIHKIFGNTTTKYGKLLPNIKYLIITNISFLKLLTHSLPKGFQKQDLLCI